MGVRLRAQGPSQPLLTREALEEGLSRPLPKGPGISRHLSGGRVEEGTGWGPHTLDNGDPGDSHPFPDPVPTGWSDSSTSKAPTARLRGGLQETKRPWTEEVTVERPHPAGAGGEEGIPRTSRLVWLSPQTAARHLTGAKVILPL